MTPKRRRERSLSDAEFCRLGQVLKDVSRESSRISPAAVAMTRPLILTDCRRTEILTLPWEHVDP